MLPLPDAHQFNLTGQPSAGLQQASGGVGLRFRAYATQVLQRSGEGAKNVSFDCNSGGWHLRGWRLKAPPTDWMPRPKAARGWANNRLPGAYGCPASLHADRDSTASDGPLRCFSCQ